MEYRAKQSLRPKIMCVDSSQSNQKLLERALDKNFDIKTAESGIQCLDALRTYAPDIILMDVDLPNFDTFKICRLIRLEPQFSATPILFISHLKAPDQQLKGFEAGGDDYIEKPIDAASLAEKLSLNLNRSQKKRTVEEEAPKLPPSLDDNTRHLHEFFLATISIEQMDKLNDLVIRTLDQFGLKSAIHWHQTGRLQSSIGPLTDLESVLLEQANSPMPLDHSARYVWGCPQFGAIIHNMPSPRNEQYQTMRDLVCTLFRVAEEKANALLRHPEALPRHRLGSPSASTDIEALRDQSMRFEAAIEAVEVNSEKYLRALSQELQRLCTDRSLDGKENHAFQRLLNQCIQTRIGIYDQCLELQNQYRDLIEALDLNLVINEPEN